MTASVASLAWGAWSGHLRPLACGVLVLGAVLLLAGVAQSWGQRVPAPPWLLPSGIACCLGGIAAFGLPVALRLSGPFDIGTVGGPLYLGLGLLFILVHGLLGPRGGSASPSPRTPAPNAPSTRPPAGWTAVCLLLPCGVGILIATLFFTGVAVEFLPAGVMNAFSDWAPAVLVGGASFILVGAGARWHFRMPPPRWLFHAFLGACSAGVGLFIIAVLFFAGHPADWAIALAVLGLVVAAPGTLLLLIDAALRGRSRGATRPSSRTRLASVAVAISLAAILAGFVQWNVTHPVFAVSVSSRGPQPVPVWLRLSNLSGANGTGAVRCLDSRAVASGPAGLGDALLQCPRVPVGPYWLEINVPGHHIAKRVDVVEDFREEVVTISGDGNLTFGPYGFD
ncbi:MAG: hypothetical protein ACYDBQ_00815 [Thermoplasmatota archaeon]